MRKNKKQSSIKTHAKKEKFAITRGQYKGLGLFLESNVTTRPTKALVKKSFFDTMQSTLYGKTFIECFAGSGQMGFEALSLGASNVIFFENDRQAFQNLQNNITLFWEKHKHYYGKPRDSKIIAECMQSIPNQPIGIQAYCRDCLQSQAFLESCMQDSKMNFAKNADFQVKNVIIPIFQTTTQVNNAVLYMDPPFACRIGFENIYTQIWHFVESFHESLAQKVDIIVIESMSNADLQTQIGAFHLIKKSKFGQTTLMYFTK